MVEVTSSYTIMVGVCSTAEIEIEAANVTKGPQHAGLGLFRNGLLSNAKRLIDLNNPIEQVPTSSGHTFPSLQETLVGAIYRKHFVVVILNVAPE